MADITGNTAPIGGGKSLWGTVACMHELEHSERFIITDIPLIFENPPQGYWTVGDYCHEFVKFPVDLAKRICVISGEQASEFWRYLPAAYFEHCSPEEFEKFGITFETSTTNHGSFNLLKLPNKSHPLFKEVPDFSFRTSIAKNRVGCHYIIDEAHKKFPPMHYQKVGAQAEWYMSELRKLDDDLDWITQHPEKVDKNFRRNCTQWMQFQNMSKSTLFMGVSIPNRFRYHWYNQSEMPTRTDKPTRSGWYSLDKKRRYHHLYKTMDGTGVSGGMLKESSLHKGRHWSIWIIAVLAILAGAYLVPRIIEKTITVGVGGLSRGVQKGLQNGVNNLLPEQQKTDKPVAAPQTQARPVTRPNNFGASRPERVPMSASVGNFSPYPPAGTYCSGFTSLNGDVNVFLSDGNTYSMKAGEVQDVGKRFVRVLGQIYPIKQARIDEGLNPAPQSAPNFVQVP